MLSADKLEQLGEPFCYESSERSSLAGIKDALAAVSEAHAIPLAFENDHIRSGGLLSRQTDECLVLFHPKHRDDYFRFCVTAKQQGAMTFVRVYSFGVSRQMKKEAIRNWTREDRKGKQLSYRIGSAMVSGILAAGRSKVKLEEEQDYYSLLKAVLAEVFG